MKHLLVLHIMLVSISAFPQEHEGRTDGVAPGMAAVFGPENGANIRFYYFANEIICFGPEVNFFPEDGHSLGDNIELSFNGHYIFELVEHIGIYPIGGVSWKNTEKHGSGFRANMGLGLHGSYGRFAPYSEYIYSAGFEDEGIFLIGTFFTFRFK